MATSEDKPGRKKTRKGGSAAKPPVLPVADTQPSSARQSKAATIDKSTEQEVNKTLDELAEGMLRGGGKEIEKVTAKLWTLRKHVPPIIVDRLTKGSSKLPGIELEMLTGFGGQKGRKYLKEIAESSGTDDIVRFGAHRRLGWPERGEAKARLSFLNSLREPEGTLVEAVRQGTSLWPPDGNILQEVVGYMEAASPEFAIRVLAQGARDIEPSLYAWVLRPLLHSHYPAVQKATLAELARTDAQASSGAIRRLSQTASDPEVRAEAEAMARRLQFRVVAGRRGAKERYQEFPPVDAVWASPVDGAGAQVFLLMRDWGVGLHLVVDVLHTDSWGVKDTFGFFRLPEAESGEMLEEFRQEELELAEIDLASARGILVAAAETNAATGHRIPPVFEVWEPLFHDAYPPPQNELVSSPDLDDTPLADRRDLYLRSAELLDHPFFDSWFFDPEEIGPLLPRVPTPGKKGITDTQLVPLVGLLVDDTVRHQLRNRLRREAWLLGVIGDTEERDLALAAAAGLSDSRKSEIGKHPLLRQMVLDSISNLFSGLVFPAP